MRFLITSAVLVVISLLISPFLTTPVFADNTSPGSTQIQLQNPLGSTTNTVGDLLNKIINWLAYTIGPVIATLMIIVGDLYILFSNGDEEKFKTGKKIILYTAIGYGIIFIGSGIEAIITKLLNS